jgi:RNA polymerase sigma-70 factor (ECF subfamily)
MGVTVSPDPENAPMSDTHASQTRVSLLERLADPADQDAWREFDRRYRPRILGWCRRWGLQEADAQDVAQRVMQRLLTKMTTFVYNPRGRFRAWLQTLAHSVLSDFRKLEARPDAASGDSEVARLLGRLEAHDDLGQRLREQFDLDLLEKASCRVRRRVARHIWEAWQGTAVEGLPGAEVARRTGLPVEQVYVAKLRVLRLLREEVRRLEG